MNIIIKNVCQNNLKNVTIDIPKRKFVVVTGISGSGKSSLVFDVIYAESQRMLLETMSTFSRISMPRFQRPKFENASGLSPAVIIDQKQLSNNPRSTVGTSTEIYSYLRLLFSRFGEPKLSAGEFSFNNPSGACENCKGTGIELEIDTKKILDFSKSLNEGAILHRSYKVGGREWNIIQATKFFDMDKKICNFTQDELELLLYSPPHKCNNIVPGFVQNFTFEGISARILKRATDSRGLVGVKYDALFTKKSRCHLCNGARVNEQARNVRLCGKSIVELSNMELKELFVFLENLKIQEADEILTFLCKSLDVMINLGLGYLTLSRPIGSLSNGESQRLKLARQLSSSLSDLIYILDEPTSGLHARDISMITETLRSLVDKGNTVIVVEHDVDVISNADYIIELGPFAGKQGGEVVFSGTYKQLLSAKTLTSVYLKKNYLNYKSQRLITDFMSFKANKNNIQNLNVKIPVGVLTCVTGVSGSGKSTLMQEFIENYPKCIVVDQSKIGTSSRSTPITYVGGFDDIRKIFAKANGVSESLFAFNSKGACHECKGLGYQVINMHFLGDVKSTCEKCLGRRYSDYVLKYKYRNKDIADVLEMTVDEAFAFFDFEPLKKKLLMLQQVGLGYITLGQSFDTLSGGEAQRIKLISGLSKSGETYILDEPTRGLHLFDIQNLMKVLNDIVDKGNTVVIVEHNMEVISMADYIIDMGPDAGKNGGTIIVEGNREKVMSCPKSYTGKYLLLKEGKI